MKQPTIACQTDYISTRHDPTQLEPWEYIDGEQPDDPEADRADDRLEVLQRLFAIVFPAGSGQGDKFEAGWRRFISLTWIVRPDLFGGMSQITIARFLGCGSANLSKHAMGLSKQLGIRGALQQSDEGRARRSISHANRDRSVIKNPGLTAEEAHRKAVRRACEKARLTIGNRNTWSKFERLALWEAGYVDDADEVTDAGREFFEAGTAQAPSPGKESFEHQF